MSGDLKFSQNHDQAFSGTYRINPPILHDILKHVQSNIESQPLCYESGVN